MDFAPDYSLDTRMVVNALKKAFKVAKPQILNSDYAEENTMPKFLLNYFKFCYLFRFFGIVFCLV